jgi:hypothetical protein
MFELKHDDSFVYCDSNQNLNFEYMILTLIYISLIILIPISIVFISNSIILFKTCKSEQLRIKTASGINVRNVTIDADRMRILFKKVKFTAESSIKPFYMNINQIISRISHKANNQKKLTKIFTLFSFSFAILNLPYFIMWIMFYYELHFSNETAEMYLNFINLLVKLTELFYIVNYGIHFWIYTATSSIFRQQLKYSCKFCCNFKYLNFFYTF